MWQVIHRFPLKHKAQTESRGHSRKHAVYENRLITKVARLHRHQDVDQLKPKTWSYRAIEAAELIGGLCNETKKICPRLKEEVLTGSLQHHFWLHLPLGLQLWFMTF